MYLQYGYQAVPLAQPNEFELQYRPDFMQHLPPLSSSQVALLKFYLTGSV